jgi:homoserine acetyltransferase
MGVIREGCPLRDFSDFVHYATDVDFDAYLQCAAGILEHDATDAFMAIKEPILMLGGEHDIFINVDDCRAFASRHPHAKFEELQCASHAGSIEYGSYVAGRVRNFMSQNLLESVVEAA